MKQIIPSLFLALTACGGSKENAPLYAYDGNSPYSEKIVQCVSAETADELCPLDTLPPLNITASAVTVDEIMARVVVSHEWMAVRFRQVLEDPQTPQAALDLFSPLTAVVISHDIRPAHYNFYTGAIYLDPAYFWSTPEEYATINQEEDYRSGYDDELSFARASWLTDQSDSYISLSDLPDTPESNRPMSRVAANAMDLLFHELAHANDFLPPSWRTEIRLPMGESTILDLIERVYLSGEMVNQTLDNPSQPILLDLADVMFWGTPPSTAQTDLSAEQIGALFEPTGQNSLYSFTAFHYRNDQGYLEDIAMLIEEALMSYTYGAVNHYFFLEKLNAEQGEYCDDYSIGWGQANRISEPQVKSRAQQAISMLLPNEASYINAHLDSLPAAQNYITGDNLCDRKLEDSPVIRSVRSNKAVERLPIRAKRHQPIRLPF